MVAVAEEVISRGRPSRDMGNLHGGTLGEVWANRLRGLRQGAIKGQANWHSSRLPERI